MFCLAATLVVALAGLIIGSILFPVGRVTTLSGDTLPLTDGIWRMCVAALLVSASLLGLAAISLFVSTMTDVSIGVIAATLGILILLGILDAIPHLATIHPWLFAHNWLSFADVMRAHISWTAIRKNLGLQAAYFAVFATAAWARFTPSDVLA